MSNEIDEFRIIPTFQNYSINKSGLIVKHSTGEFLNPYDVNGEFVELFDSKSFKNKIRRIDNLIKKAFRPVIKQDVEKNIFVSYEGC